MPQPVATRTQRNGLALSGRHEPFPTLFSLQVFEVADMVHNQLSRCPAQFAFFRFEPVRQIGAAHVCDRVRFDVAASVERRCPAFETCLVKGSGLDYPFLLVLYGEQFVETVLLLIFRTVLLYLPANVLYMLYSMIYLKLCSTTQLLAIR